MTSPFATNAVFKALKKQRWLEVDKEGKPLQGQVPQTYQMYSGQGGETIVYDGSNCLVIENALTTGPLTVDFSATQDNFGREMLLILRQTLANNFTMDFGTGTVFIPGAGTASSVTTPAGFGPACGDIEFFSRTEAAIIKNCLVLPGTILPGSDGQVLTTVAGTVQWADPPAPKVLSFPILVDPGNELNSDIDQEIAWTSTGAAENDTTLIVSPTNFEVTDTAKYDIHVEIFIPGNLDVGLRASLYANSTQILSMDSVFGLTGQRITFDFCMTIGQTQVISVRCRNQTGPDSVSGSRSITPAASYYGRIVIKQF